MWCFIFVNQVTDFRITMVTHLWVYLWGCFQGGLTGDGRPNPEDGQQHHPMTWGLALTQKEKASWAPTLILLRFLAREATWQVSHSCPHDHGLCSFLYCNPKSIFPSLGCFCQELFCLNNEKTNQYGREKNFYSDNRVWELNDNRLPGGNYMHMHRIVAQCETQAVFKWLRFL